MKRIGASPEVTVANMDMTGLNACEHRIGLTGPVILITLGVLFLMDTLAPGWGIGRTWPVLLVVVGILRLVETARPPRPPRGPRVS